MNTVAFNTALSDEEKISRMNAAMSHCSPKDLTYSPYCIMMKGEQYSNCTSPRMTKQPYGWKCPDCGNMIGFNMERLEESPFNNPDHEERWFTPISQELRLNRRKYSRHTYH
jgi:hypothetical protein